jgi:hypothetical protein
MQIVLPDERTIEVRCRPSAFQYAWERLIEDLGDEWWEGLELDTIEKEVSTYVSALRGSFNADDLLNGSTQDYKWVVPDMLEFGDRLVLTGVEGGGKSTLILQWLTQIACGIHPLTNKPLPWNPTVLFLDLEYGEAELRRRIKTMRQCAGKAWNPENIHIVSRPDGIDLRAERDQEWLANLVSKGGFEVVGISPLYKTFEGDEGDDVVANEVSGFLNILRSDCALISEAHVPHPGPTGKLIKRPIGSSVWKRWPEFGIFLAPNDELQHFRGPRDASREWPAALRRGGNWPFTPIDPGKGEDLRWKKLKAWSVKNGKKPTTRQAAEILGVSQATATRVMKDHANDWPDSLIHADSSAS